MLDRPTNHLRRDFIAHPADEVPIVPQLPTPQLLLHLGKLLKDYSDRDALQPLYDLCQTIPRGSRQKNMHMIVQDFLGIDFKLISFSNFLKSYFQSVRDSLVQHHATIFGHPHHMIFEIVDSSTGSFDTHAWKNTKLSPLRGLALFLPSAS